MNFIAGTLLMVLPEEKVFWILVRITDVLIKDYYTKNMVGTIVDQRLFVFLIKKNFPKLYSHLEKINFTYEAITTKWFVSLFVGVLPAEMSFRVMDCVMMKGADAIIEISLGIFKQLESKILKMDEEHVIGKFLSDYCSTCYDSSIFDCVGNYDETTLLGYRMSNYNSVETKLKQLDSMRDMMSLAKCSYFS